MEKEVGREAMSFSVIHECEEISKTHKRAIEKYVDEHQMPKSQHRLLITLSCLGPETCQKDLAERLQITPAAVAITLRKLEKDGLVERKISPKDNRYKIITVTEKGNKIVKESERAFYSIDEDCFQEFTDKEIETLSHSLKKLLHNLEKMERSRDE